MVWQHVKNWELGSPVPDHLFLSPKQQKSREMCHGVFQQVSQSNCWKVQTWHQQDVKTSSNQWRKCVDISTDAIILSLRRSRRAMTLAQEMSAIQSIGTLWEHLSKPQEWSYKAYKCERVATGAPATPEQEWQAGLLLEVLPPYLHIISPFHPLFLCCR